ncbi:hypothetical protein A2197_02840 [Candidatus Woesebacteria bacterium RIFOXYA1_FULL_48_16]|uniref:Uncharacterized protein n=1 Tax=Candidatus Woesebacteria bacterium RIFOXYA1_FULL_48_16 TaxID=1802535 RepID=A0A1F8CQI3_9BACT|nr:MAG: hypothetical protein A2197_02840 [Candidatus Woesebacteria bacterium RIFOXYA1_FULL_48_16]
MSSSVRRLGTITFWEKRKVPAKTTIEKTIRERLVCINFITLLLFLFLNYTLSEVKITVDNLIESKNIKV